MKIDWDEFERTRGEFKLDGKDCLERSDPIRQRADPPAHS